MIPAIADDPNCQLLTFFKWIVFPVQWVACPGPGREEEACGGASTTAITTQEDNQGQEIVPFPTHPQPPGKSATDERQTLYI